MTKVIGITAEHQQSLADSQVVRCMVVGNDLVTVLGDGTVITVGNVQGPQGATGPTGDKGSDWPRLLLVGSVNVPSVANQWVFVDIELPAVWGTSIPVVVAQASTNLPGTRVAYLGVSVVEGLITIKSFRTDGNTHMVYFTAMEEG